MQVKNKFSSLHIPDSDKAGVNPELQGLIVVICGFRA